MVDPSVSKFIDFFVMAVCYHDQDHSHPNDQLVIEIYSGLTFRHLCTISVSGQNFKVIVASINSGLMDGLLGSSGTHRSGICLLLL